MNPYCYTAKAQTWLALSSSSGYDLTMAPLTTGYSSPPRVSSSISIHNAQAAPLLSLPTGYHTLAHCGGSRCRLGMWLGSLRVRVYGLPVLCSRGQVCEWHGGLQLSSSFLTALHGDRRGTRVCLRPDGVKGLSPTMWRSRMQISICLPPPVSRSLDLI